MSIASRITSIEGHISDIYDSVELTGVDTTDIDKNLVNVPNTLKEGYVDIINNGTDTLYNNFPKVSGEGTSLTLNNTYQAPMRNNLKGNTSQTGTPTPTSPIPVNVVSGDNEIIIANEDNTDSNTYNIDLPSGMELCSIPNTPYKDEFKRSTGKNLAPINLESETYNSLQITNNNNGTFTLLGNPTGSFGRDIATNLTLKAGTYTISANAMPSGLYIALDNTAETQLSSGTLSKTFTLASDTTYTSLGIWFTKNKDYDVTIQLQIEEGSSVSEWQPKEGWYKEKNIEKIVYNGTEEGWAVGSLGTNSYTIELTNQKLPSETTPNFNLSNLFKGVPFAQRITGNNIIYSTNPYLYIRNTSYTSLADFKTMLGTTNLVSYYVLATPTSEGIPSNLINQLEELYIAKSKENQTNISQINNDLGFIISASALKKG